MIKNNFFQQLYMVKIYNLDNQDLANDIVNWSKQDQGVKKTNVNGWHSTTDMHLKPEYQPLVQELYRMQKNIYKKNG